MRGYKGFHLDLPGVGEDAAWFSLEGGEAPGFEREVLEGFARLHKLSFEVVRVERVPGEAEPVFDVGVRFLDPAEARALLAPPRA